MKRKAHFLMAAVLLRSIIAVTVYAASPTSAPVPDADNVVKGILSDSKTGEGVGFATVAIFTSDSTAVAVGTSAEDGAFKLTCPAGKFRFKASLIGYKDLSMEVQVKGGPIDLGSVRLEEDTQMIEAAKVTHKVPLVEMNIDKMVVNISQSASALTSNALDLLRKSPGVTVDKDGNVKLNSKTVEIWVDGRPSHLDGDALVAMLTSTEGSNIDKFELMEHPSAKYDAQGQGGIIDIKMKKNSLKGFQGSVNVSGGGMYFGQDIKRWCGEGDGGFNLGYRTKKTSSFLNFNGGGLSVLQKETIDMLAQESAPGEPRYSQYSESMIHGKYKHMNVKLGNDWFIDDKNTLGFIVSLPRMDMNLGSSPEDNESIQKMGDEIISRTHSDMSSPSGYNQTSVNLNFTHVFDRKKSEELTVNADWYLHSSNSGNRTVTKDHSSAEITSDLNLVSSSRTDIWSVKGDYQRKVFGKAMLEAGAKWSRSGTLTGMDRTEAPQPSVHSDFHYVENIAAAYFDIAGKIGEKFSYKGGIRGEYTHSLGISTEKGRIPRSYFNVFPTVFLGYNPSDKLNLSASYSRRIYRPRYSQLDPMELRLDANNCIVGNPDLQPEYYNSFSLSAKWHQYYSASLNYGHTRDLQSQIPSFSEGQMKMKWENFGHLREAGLGLNITELPFTKWLNWTINLDGIYVFSTSYDKSIFLKTPCLDGYTSFTFILPKDWKLELNGYGTTSYLWGQIRFNPMWAANFSARKTLLDGKLALSLSVDDIFRSMRNDVDMITEGFEKSVIGQETYMQAVKLGLVWNFGKKQQIRARKVGDLEEAARTKGGTSMGK